MAEACPYGTHRAVEPPGALPQAAWRLDNSPEIAANEILLDVHTLNIDAASFRQIKQAAGGDPEQVKAALLALVRERGKLHNPVTGSGGMLLGRVRAVGPALADRGLQPGDEIATLVSLTLTPLHLEAITRVHLEADQVEVQGHAILFASGLYARLPADLPRRVALAALDVCGAPARTAHLVRPGMKVLILGLGKSGLLCAHEAKKRAGVTGTVVGVDASQASVERALALGLVDAGLHLDATRPLAVMRAVTAALQGEKADLTLVNVNVPGAEMGAILSTRPTGTVYFFSMATSFTAAALGAEGAGSPVQMLIGNGYTPGHAEMALQILRENAGLRALFERLYGQEAPPGG